MPGLQRARGTAEEMGLRSRWGPLVQGLRCDSQSSRKLQEAPEDGSHVV